MSGSGGDTGYDFQADAIAYVAAHALSGQPLSWFDDHKDIPSAWLAETGGPGDDIRIINTEGLTIELQAKHGLQKGEEYNVTFRKLINGLHSFPQLRAVLLVDHHASLIIRDDLKRDLVRLGQGRSDDIRPITRELLDDLQMQGLSGIAVFARFRIVVVDLDLGSDGAAAAQAMLTRVVAAKDSPTAYTLLGKRGHQMIKNRGRDDVYQCAKFLDTSVGLASVASSPAITMTRFAKWVLASYGTFYSPALQSNFPIHRAWSQVALMDSETEPEAPPRGLDKLEAQIKRYQEWARLLHRRGNDSALAADTFAAAHRLSVIVGGPGSGKSTIGRRLAFQGAEDRLAVLVRLPTVGALLASGNTFEAALIAAGTDSSGCNHQDGKHILAAADLLVADGLDECDPHRVSIAAGLSRWAASHPHTRVCVLTRPIGHSPALLPNFSHAELLPLENWNIRKIADWMIASQVSEPPRAAAALSDFMNAVEERNGGNVASIAARNPLLLSFLVRLFLDGQPIHGKRTALFQRIIELIRQTPPLDRKLVGPIPDQTTAWAAAEQAGWSCIDQPNRPTTEVYTLIAAKLGGGIDARRRAEFAVYQWTEHGLMEQLKVGSLDALVFVHLALGEYLAGRHLAQLDTSTLAQAIEKYRRKAKWREPILLAAGAGAAEPVIGALLSLDSPGDPTSTEALLAAAAIAESDVGAVSESTVQSVAERLKSRLYSIVPLISVEAGLGLIDLAPLVPELVASVAVELRHHDQPWTRLSALCAGLSTGSTLIPIEEVVQWIEQFSLRPEFSVSSRTGQWFSGTHDLQRPAIAKALRRVAEELPATTAEHIIVSFLSRKDLSISMVGAARAELTEEPYKYWVARASVSTWGTSVQRLEGMSQASERWRAGNVTIFKCILVACGREQTADPHQFSEYRLLGELLSSMGYWELEMPDLAAVTEDHSDVLLAEVLRGMIIGLGLDAHRLGDEANAWLNSLLKSSDEIWPPHGIKREPHANAIIGAKLDLKLVASAMHQTSWFIAWNAARLFEAIIPAPNQQELLRSVLLHGRGRTLWLVGLLAGAIWGSEAFETIHERLGMQLSAGCGYLYEPMIKAAQGPEQLELGVQTALHGIADRDPEIAEVAAEALRVVDSQVLASHRDRMRKLLDDWALRGRWCPQCNKRLTGLSCDTCHTVPWEPRKHLVYLLSKAGALSVEELLELAIDEGRDVGQEAREGLVRLAFENSSAMRKVIAKIDTGFDSGRLLDEILKQPVELVRQVSDQLLPLLHSPSAAVREGMVRSLNSGWISTEVAHDLGRRALEDGSPQVRSAAVRLLRGQSEI